MRIQDLDSTEPGEDQSSAGGPVAEPGLFVGIADIPAADTAPLARLAQYGPGFAHCATVTAILVRLAEPTALVLAVRRVRHGDDSDP